MRAITIAFLGCALLLGTGCAGGTAPPPSTTTTGEQTATTASPAGTPFPGENPVHLLYISDSGGWETAEAYTAIAEEQLGVDVELVDWRVGGLPLRNVPALIAANPDVVAHAEIVVLFGSPAHSGAKMDQYVCVDHEGLGDPGVYTVADWDPYAALAGDIVDSIWELRDRKPTAIRMTDAYIPLTADWEEHGVFEPCMTSFETMSEALRGAAEAHGATFVSSLDTYNGPDHRRDARAAGLIADEIHPSAAGGKAMAEALAAVGFQPGSAP